MILILLGCITATVSVAVIWMHEVVADADRYADTVAPLSQETVIKDAVADSVTTELFTQIHADQLAQEALPDKLDFLASPIVGATEEFVRGEVRKQLDSPEFSRIWKEANRKGHEIVMQVLQGDNGSVYARDGKIVLDLSGLFEIVKARLDDRGIHIFDNIALENTGFQLTVFESGSITQAQQIINMLNRLAYWLPPLALLLLGAAVWLSRSRAAAVYQIGLSLAAGMVALLVALALARGAYIDAATGKGNVDVPAATAFFDVIVGSVATSIKRAFAVSLLLAAIGFSLSPYPASRQIRAFIWQTFSKAEGRAGKIDLAPTGAWVARQKTALRAGGIVAALVALVAMDKPSLSWALLIMLTLIVYLMVIEALARRA